jgi:hypothetical protein
MMSSDITQNTPESPPRRRGALCTPELMLPRWLGVLAAVRYSSISRARLYTLMAEGEIRSASVRSKGATRGHRIIDRKSIDAFLESLITEGGK